MNTTRKFEQLYAKIPSISECKGLCHSSCGPVRGSLWEINRLKQHATETEHANPLTCPYLDKNNRCSAYDQRPAICRIWGTSEILPCEYGCLPDGKVLTMAETDQLITEAHSIGGPETGLGIDAHEDLREAYLKHIRSGGEMFSQVMMEKRLTAPNSTGPNTDAQTRTEPAG